MNHTKTEIAATAVEQFNISRSSLSGNTPTSGTFTDNVHREKQQRCWRRLRRPTRRPRLEGCRQAVGSPSVDPDAEEIARQRLQDRMPARSRIQAINDRRKAANERDPWLEDAYDWRP
jgi:hypothetical protein